MKKNINPLVCVFDSGIGGLGVLYECVRRLPRVDFAYFADNYNMPYGRFGREELIKISNEKFTQIASYNPAAAVVACNTVTAQCIGFLRENFPFEIIGIQPAVKPASAVGGKCLVLATPSTAQSNSLHDLIGRFGSGETKVAPCSDLASYIEENVGNFNPAEVERLLPKESADSVVLGCTHYSFVKDIIKNYYNCPVFDGNEGTSAHLCEKLGISDHRAERAQSIAFIGGNTDKNRSVFRSLIVDSGVNSLKV